jgi:hypothetical protein
MVKKDTQIIIKMINTKQKKKIKIKVKEII